MAKTVTKRTGPKTTKLRSSSPRARWDLRLYIAGRTPRAEKALENLERICTEHLAGQYRVVVIDLLKTPHLARGDQIVAVPTLVRNLPTPMRRIIGDLSNTERVLIGLDIRAR
jgi:circadian clock protein KaiB